MIARPVYVWRVKVTESQSWFPTNHYLSVNAANKRADMLRSAGATVEVERSEQVMWP